MLSLANKYQRSEQDILSKIHNGIGLKKQGFFKCFSCIFGTSEN